MAWLADIFLSPLKPPTKDSVSAEAINSSLYYLHVATPEDDSLLQEVEEEQEEDVKLHKELFGDEPESGPGQQEFARLNNVRRKPVPGENSGKASNMDADANTNISSPPLQQVPQGKQGNTPPSLHFMPEQRPHILPPTPPPFPESKPNIKDSKENVPGQHVQFLERRPTQSRLLRRPLPRVPDNETSWDVQEGGHPAKNPNRWSAMAGYASNQGFESWKDKHEVSSTRHSLDSNHPQLRARSAYDSPSPSGRSPGQSPNRQSHESRSPDPSAGFHITLIRRDPTHGTQWNVATISTALMDDGEIDLEISTPGYSRFIAKDEPLSLDNLGLNIQTDGGGGPSLAAIQALRESAGHLLDINNTSNNKPQQEPPGPRRFRRKLSVSKPPQDDGRASMDQPTGVRGSIDSIAPGSLTAAKQQSLSKLKSGYYSFTSPWNGVCTFSTSVNGRSLKCKHMIPMPIPPGGAAENANPAVTVAEIRFNTPFQPGHLRHQPNPYHLSPFALSQTPAFPTPHPDILDPALTSTTPNANAPNSPPTGTTNPTSKRASLAALLKTNTLTNRPRSQSNTSTHSTTTPANANPAVNNTINLGPGLGNLTRKPSTNSTTSVKTTATANDDPDRLDFSLARERAGGGMRGKSAKLGKLVVEDEGIKMLDLVVAACMGVWWRGYYY